MWHAWLMTSDLSILARPGRLCDGIAPRAMLCRLSRCLSHRRQANMNVDHGTGVYGVQNNTPRPGCWRRGKGRRGGDASTAKSLGMMLMSLPRSATPPYLQQQGSSLLAMTPLTWKRGAKREGSGGLFECGRCVGIYPLFPRSQDHEFMSTLLPLLTPPSPSFWCRRRLGPWSDGDVIAMH
ncbi:hypothetical protein LY76DRAFT_401281 [Colletotrichum caudatum]|nr:hypothetical protein LY76DRAFT_401281 [Colletotrichum caudatum]